MIAAMVISNLLYLVGAIVAATLVSGIVLLRHRRPRSLESSIEMFSRELKALKPEHQGTPITPPEGLRRVAGTGPEVRGSGVGGAGPERRAASEGRGDAGPRAVTRLVPQPGDTAGRARVLPHRDGVRAPSPEREGEPG